MQFRLGIFRGSEQITSGELIYVNADPRTRRPAPWPEALAKAILAYEKLKPERA
jgi:acyl-CoA thioesterase FadM